MVGLRVFLARHRLSQSDLARAVDISTAAMSQIMTGATNPSKPTIDRILEYARTFEPEVGYDELFNQPEPERPAAVGE
jgi:transcriptional regulator with XRE-family HTH domain